MRLCTAKSMITGLYVPARTATFSVNGNSCKDTTDMCWGSERRRGAAWNERTQLQADPQGIQHADLTQQPDPACSPYQDPRWEFTASTSWGCRMDLDAELATTVSSLQSQPARFRHILDCANPSGRRRTRMRS